MVSAKMQKKSRLMGLVRKNMELHLWSPRSLGSTEPCQARCHGSQSERRSCSRGLTSTGPSVRPSPLFLTPHCLAPPSRRGPVSMPFILSALGHKIRFVIRLLKTTFLEGLPSYKKLLNSSFSC